MNSKKLLSLALMALLVSSSTSCKKNVVSSSNAISTIVNSGDDDSTDRIVDSDEEKTEKENIDSNKSTLSASDFVYEFDITKTKIYISNLSDTSKTSINIPSTLTIDKKTYSVVQITENAFDGCNSLVEVTIPKSIEKIGRKAFSGCSSLKKITVSSLNTNYASHKGILYNNDFSSIVVCPTSYDDEIVVPNSIKTISAYAFANCTSLTTISLPKSVISVREGAFYNCTSLSEINLSPNLTYIGEGAFSKTNITEIAIPKNVTYVGAWAFKDCVNLLRVVLPEGIDTVKYMLFAGCLALTYVYIPTNVTTIEHNVFSGCIALTSIYIPSSVTTISKNAFYNIFSAVINCEAAEQLPNWSADFNPNALTVNYGVTTINFIENETNRFDATKILTFAQNGLIYQQLEPNGTDVKIIGYEESNNQAHVTISAQINVQSAGAESKTFNVVAVDDGAFKSNTILESVTFDKVDSTLQRIGTHAFSDCENLESVVFNVDSSVTAISNVEVSDYAFANCLSLAKVSLPNTVKKLNSCAFSDCKSLDITASSADSCDLQNAFPGVEKYENFVFDGARFKNSATTDDIVSVYLNKTVTHLGSYVFSGTNFTTLEVPVLSSGLNKLNQFALSNSVINTFNISDTNGNYIEYNGSIYNKDKTELIFANNGQDTIELPSTVKKINEYAFENSTEILKNSFVVSNNDNFFVENGILYSVEKHEDENGNIEEIVTLLRAPTDTTTSKVNISDRTNYIASGAFANCSYSNIILNSNLIGIGDYAFKNCLKLQYITVQEGTEYIGRGAFENCIKLVLPTLPATISSLSVELFKNCTSLETIKLPTTLTEIGDSAFNGCTSLEKLHFTNSVNDIASNAFEGCSSLTTIEIDSGNKVYGYDGGGLYNVAYNSLTNKYEPVELVQVIVQTDTLTLPATVSNIAESAFDSLDLVNSLTVDSRNQYFKFVKDKSIAGTDVDNTGALFKLDPSGNCAELFFVPKSSTSITLDKNVNSISAYAFSHLGDDFKSINVASDNANYTAVGTTDNYVLYNKDKTTLVKVPVAADVNEIATTCTTISKGAFYGNKVVDSLVFSDGINNISDGEFLDTNLKNISNINQYMINKYNKLFSADNIETVDHIKATTIPGATFYGMVGLRSVTLDEGVTLIDNAAFKNCSNLTTFSLPSSVETVGNAAFENCFSMSNFTFATTNSLLTIGNAVFKGCTSLTTLTNLSNCTVLDTLGKEAFMGCTALTSIDFSATKVSTFNESVFANCTSLTSITFNQRENAIKAYAFKNTGFTTFTLPANISDVNLDVTCFDDCSKLVAFRASSSSNTRFHNGLLSTDSAYLYYNNNSKLIKIPNALTGAVAITQTTTTTIATNAFRGCNKITSAQLGNGSNSSINSITDGELKDCTSLTTVTLTNDYLVQQYSKMITKDDGTKLAVTDVKIGNFIGAIADESFKDCTALVNVTAYNPSNSMTSFTKIGNNAFSGCTSLTTLFDLTNSSQSTSSVNRLAYLAEFGTSAFENCSSMQYFTLPKVLRTIGNNAFKGCSSIISIKTRSNYITSSSATWNPDGLNFS